MSDILIALSGIYMLADYNLITNHTTDYVAQTLDQTLFYTRIWLSYWNSSRKPISKIYKQLTSLH